MRITLIAIVVGLLAIAVFHLERQYEFRRIEESTPTYTEYDPATKAYRDYDPAKE